MPSSNLENMEISSPVDTMITEPHRAEVTAIVYAPSPMVMDLNVIDEPTFISSSDYVNDSTTSQSQAETPALHESNQDLNEMLSVKPSQTPMRRKTDIFIKKILREFRASIKSKFLKVYVRK